MPVEDLVNLSKCQCILGGEEGAGKGGKKKYLCAISLQELV